MKHYLGPVYALLLFAFLSSASALAENREKMVIALEGDDFELAETDISSLAIGEAQTIETESGKIIDILRTGDGAEIYIDGELLEMNFNEEGLHEEHMLKKHVEIVCDDGQECEKNIVIIGHDDDEDMDIESLHEEHGSGEGHKVVVIRKVQIKED